MASLGDSFEVPRSSVLQRVLPWALGLVILLAIGWFIYSQLNTVVGVKKDEPPPVTATVDLTPPPPPPPPPPPEPQEKPPEPSPEAPTPNPEPAPKPDAPAPMTINGPAEAGQDSFGLQSGSGLGNGSPNSTGTCVGSGCGSGGGGGGQSDSLYRRALGNALQSEIEKKDQLRRRAFSAFFLITVDAEGRVSRVQLDQSSGNRETDAQIQAALEQARNLDRPPSYVKFPQRIKITGKRSVG